MVQLFAIVSCYLEQLLTWLARQYFLVLLCLLLFFIISRLINQMLHVVVASERCHWLVHHEIRLFAFNDSQRTLFALDGSRFFILSLLAPGNDPMAEHISHSFANLVFFEYFDEFFQSKFVDFEWVFYFCFFAEFVWTYRFHYFHNKSRVRRESKCNHGHRNVFQAQFASVCIVHDLKVLSGKPDIVEIGLLFLTGVLVRTHPLHYLLENHVLSSRVAKQVEKFDGRLGPLYHVVKSLIRLVNTVKSHSFCYVFDLLTIKLVMEAFQGVPMVDSHRLCCSSL